MSAKRDHDRDSEQESDYSNESDIKERGQGRNQGK